MHFEYQWPQKLLGGTNEHFEFDEYINLNWKEVDFILYFYVKYLMF